MKRFFELFSRAALIALAISCSDCTENPGNNTDGGGDGGQVTCTDPATCVCTKASDCGKRTEWICISATKKCQAICDSDAKCGSGEVCEDFICRKPACVVDEDCNSGNQCVGEKCEPAIAASRVASCLVQPTDAVLRAGEAREFSVVTKDAAGVTLPYKGAVTWNLTNATKVGSEYAVQVSATGSGAVEIGATVGTATCASASAVAYGDVAAGTRVVVVDLVTSKPVENALVVIGSEEQRTDANGAATFASVTGKKTVSVFSSAYSFVTLLDVVADDVVAYVQPKAVKVGFKGTKKEEDFSLLQALNETVHIMLGGSSIAGNLIDIDFETLVGDMVETELDLGSTKQEVPLPGGTVIGLGKQMFKTDYHILATPGVRTVWALGGNASFADLSGAIAPALSDTSNINIGGILSALLPIIGRLQSGAVTGLQTPAPRNDGEPAYTSIDIPLNTLLRLNLKAKLPTLPAYTVAGSSYKFEGAVVLGGALYSPQGLVPLGLTAGIDEDSDTKVQDGKVNNPLNRDQDGTLPLRLAPRHSGLETGKFVGLALAASFSGLVGGDKNAPKPPLVLSGLVNFPGRFAYEKDAAKAPSVNFDSRNWLSVSDSVNLTGRTVTLDPVTGAAFYRLDFGDDETGKWSVYFGAGTAAAGGFDIPAVPGDFASDDRLTKDDGDLVLQSISISTEGLDYEGVAKFNSTNMDDLTNHVDAFSTRGVKR